MNYNEYLFKQHILFEFLHNDPNKISILYEGRSVVPGIDTILEKIMQMVEGQIYETINSRSRSTIKKYTDINVLGLSNLFFDSINFEIRLNVEPECNQNGGVEIRDLKYCGDSTKIPLVIDFNIDAPDEEGFRRLLYLGFGHEITHAYGTYQYMMKYKKDFSISEFTNHTNYENFRRKIWDSRNTKAIKNLHYRLSRVEMNAYIAQLRQELLLKKDMITDVKSAMTALRQTRSYKKNYEYIEKQLGMLRDFEDDEEFQEEMIKITEQVSGKKFSNYNQLLRYYYERWAYYQKEYMRKACKIIYDIYNNERFVFDGRGI